MRLRPGMRRGTEDLMLQVVVSGSIHYTVRSSGSLGKHYVEVHTKEMLFTSVTFQSQERAGF